MTTNPTSNTDRCTCIHDDGTQVPGENPDCPVDGWEDEDTSRVIDMSEIAALVQRAGVKCIVEQTGGGVATIFAGEEIEPGRYQAAMGPGWFEGHNGNRHINPRAWDTDCYVGPDNDDDGTYYCTEGMSNEDIAARLVEVSALYPA